MKKTVSHPVVGEVTVSRTRRATRIALSVRPDGSVRLSYPLWVTHRRAMQFLDEKLDWIADNRRKMADRYPSEPITSYRTRSHTLKLTPREVEKPTVRISDGEINVIYPSRLSPESVEVQSAVGRGIVEALRIEAKEMLPARVRELALLHGFRCGDVRVKAARSKWGSCTARNDINLTLFLVQLPDHLIDYIILHELCHTVHKDHSARFHALLDSVTGGRDRELNLELRSYRPSIQIGGNCRSSRNGRNADSGDTE